MSRIVICLLRGGNCLVQILPTMPTWGLGNFLTIYRATNGKIKTLIFAEDREPQAGVEGGGQDGDPQRWLRSPR